MLSGYACAPGTPELMDSVQNPPEGVRDIMSCQDSKQNSLHFTCIKKKAFRRLLNWWNEYKYC